MATKKLDPVQAALEAQKASDWAAIKGVAAPVGAIAADVGTLPVRALLGAGNTIVRGVNALLPQGVNVPYAPIPGGDAANIMPYLAAYRAQQAALTPPAPVAPAAPATTGAVTGAGAGRGGMGGAPALAPAVPAVTPLTPTTLGKRPAAPGKTAAPGAMPTADTGVDQAALAELVQRGLAQDLGNGIIAVGGTGGGESSFTMPWLSQGGARRPGDVEVLRGAQSTYATPELGYNNEITPEMFAGSLLQTGGMKGAADLQRLALQNVLAPQTIGAEAQVRAAQAHAGATLGAAQIGAAAQQAIEESRAQAIGKQGQQLTMQIPDPLIPGVYRTVPAGMVTMGPNGIPQVTKYDFAGPQATGKVPGQIYVDAKGNRAVYQADGTYKPVGK